jgi:pSer/pThr/pTyr-binding forkhead associated (FHA) protein
LSPPRAAGRAGREKAGAQVQGFVLTVIDGQLQGREFHFDRECKLGRIDENDVVLVDVGVSRQHVRVYGKRGVYLVEDLGSSNGTRLNGEVIEKLEVLRDGDYIGIGNAVVQFSNLDLSRSGDPTARIRLSPKQQARLDNPKAAAGGQSLAALMKTPRGRLLAIGGALALLLLGAGMLKQCRGKQVQRTAGQQELSAQPIEYDDYQAQGYWSWSFGYGAFNRNYRDQVTFHYVKPPQKLRVTLEYAAWGIDDSEEVVILVNGKRAGTVPPTRAFHLGEQLSYEYDYGLRLVIDGKLIKDGDNLVTFDNTKNDAQGTDLWEISYVKLRETAIPAPSLEKAKECFYNAKNVYEQRHVDPANMQKAIQNYECARDYLEEMPARPPDYQVSTKEIDRINKELSKIFKTALFDAQKEFRYERIEEARQGLKTAMMYFQANQRDPRFIQLKQALDRISQ